MSPLPEETTQLRTMSDFKIVLFIVLLYKKYCTNTTLALYLENRYLNAADTDFVNLVSADIENYRNTATPDRVLVFPPVESYYRFLIHKTVEDFPDLHSFSIGAGDDRRTVVCQQLAITRGRQMDGCSNDIPEHIARIHKSVSMKQPHWDHDGFTQEETKPWQISEGHQLHGPGKSRSRLNARSDHSPQSPNFSRDEKNIAEDCMREHHCSKSAATEQLRNKGRRPDIQVYVPRAKRLQHSTNIDCSQKEMSEDNTSHDKSGNQGLEKPFRRPKHKSRPSLEPYVPRPRRSPQQTENTTTGQLGASDIGRNTVKGHGTLEKEQSMAGDVLQKDGINQSVESGSSVGQSSPERLKRSPNYLEMEDEDLESQTGKQRGHHKSKRKHHSKDKEGREERKSPSKERKIKHHSKHKKHQSKDNVNGDDRQSCTAGADDCGNAGHSVTSGTRNMFETGKRTSSEACDLEDDTPSVTCLAGLTMERVSSVSGKSNHEPEPLGKVSQSRVEVESECHLGESKVIVDGGMQENISDAESAVKVDSRLDSKMLTVLDDVIKECKDCGAKSEDCDPDQSCDGLQVDSAQTVDGTCTELSDEIMEVDGELVEQRDQSCSVGQPASTPEVNSLCVLKDGVTSHIVEEEVMTSVQGCEMKAASGSLMSDTSQEFSSESGHLNHSCQVADRQSAVASQSEGSLQRSHSAAENNQQVAGTQTEENSQSQKCLKELKPCISSQSEARKESSQPEKAVDESLLKSSHKSGQSEEKSGFKPTELKQSIEEDSWDKLYDESGEALDSKLMEELTAAVGNVEVQKPEFDYYSYQPKDPDLDYEAYAHLIEIYDFPSSLITRDLFIAFKEFEESGFDIKWVDDNHAIGVFSSAFAAKSALTLQHPLIKVRPLCEATRQTKVKAKKACEFLQPYRPRPETVASVARNLVAGALGIRSKVPKEKREEERRKLHDARERKRQSTREKRDVWNGIIGHCAMDEM